MTDKILIKEIRGYDCEIFAVIHHQRKEVGKAAPMIKVYEDSTDIPVLGVGIRKKTYYFSVLFCDGVEKLDGAIEDASSFDLHMHLENKHKEIVPFDLYDVTSGDITPYGWRFDVTDPEAVKRLMDMYQMKKKHEIEDGSLFAVAGEHRYLIAKCSIPSMGEG